MGESPTSGVHTSRRFFPHILSFWKMNNQLFPPQRLFSLAGTSIAFLPPLVGFFIYFFFGGFFFLGGFFKFVCKTCCWSPSLWNIYNEQQVPEMYILLSWPWLIALLVKAHWEGEIGISELYLSFYPRPNISDRFRSHFICIKIFQIDFHLILYL